VKVKFIGTTPEEDKIVDIPEGTGVVEISLPTRAEKDASYSAWPFALVVVAGMATLVALAWLVTRG
jgi:hypothetical protein